MGVSKNNGTPKMDKLYKGKPYEQMDDLGGKIPYFWRATHIPTWYEPVFIAMCTPDIFFRVPMSL